MKANSENAVKKKRKSEEQTISGQFLWLVCTVMQLKNPAQQYLFLYFFSW
jgi:hypothetical protein